MSDEELDEIMSHHLSDNGCHLFHIPFAREIERRTLERARGEIGKLANTIWAQQSGLAALVAADGAIRALVTK